MLRALSTSTTYRLAVLALLLLFNHPVARGQNVEEVNDLLRKRNYMHRKKTIGAQLRSSTDS